MSRRAFWILGLVVGSLGLAAVLFQVSKARSFQFFGEIIARIDTARPSIALTFDDGPTAAHTEEVLSILAAHDVPATFFLTGREMAEQRALTQAIVASGHEIGNHSWSHPRMVLLAPSRVAEEIERTDAEIRAAGYEGPIHFRPPYGKKLFSLPWYLARNDRLTVTWDIEPETYPDVAADHERITAHVLEQARPGSIVLLHVMYASREPSRAALPGIITGLRERGFELVTVAELLQQSD